MLCQHSSITKGGNGTISLLTGKSCHSLTKRHSSFPLKMERVLLTALKVITGSKGMHAIWICDRARACACDHTPAGMQRLRDVSWAAAGCVCVQTQSVNSYWTGGGEAARLKGMREKQEGESGGYYGAWLQTVFLTPPIITLTAYPVLSISLPSSSFSNLSRLKTLIFSSSNIDYIYYICWHLMWWCNTLLHERVWKLSYMCLA